MLFYLKILVFLIPFMVFSQGKNVKSQLTFGQNFIPKEVLNPSAMKEIYQNLLPKDSVAVVFRSMINEVCSAKGCWMKTSLEDAQEIMIKFRDYAFFVPHEILGKEVLVNGRAYVTEISAEERRHYAEDAGKDPAKINAIQGSLRTFSFLADGIIVLEK